MLTLRVSLCCGVLWGLSSGCASTSAAVRPDAPVPEAAGAPGPRTPSGYGYVPWDPIKVGGGPRGEHEYLQFLRGPEGQELSFKRRGSCCSFEDATLPMKGGLLDMYEVTYDGAKEPATLYLDMYRREEPHAPAGFRLD